MNSNALQNTLKKIIVRINLLEKKFDDNFDALNESKIKKLNRDLNENDTI